jgi:uncharacterized membrane protein YbhN (UPF0104 family)
MGITRVERAARNGRYAVPAGAARLGRALWLIGAAAVGAFLVREVLTGRLNGAVVDLARSAPVWIVVALACEVLSYGLYATAQRRLLGRDGRGVGVPWLASLAVAAQCVSNFVPAGYLAANLLNFRELRRRGLSSPISAWLLVMSSALYIGALACLTLAGAAIAGNRAGASLEGVCVGAVVVLIALPLGFLTFRLLLRRGALRPPAAWRVIDHRPSIPLPAAAGAGLLFAASWLADAACLLAAIRAAGAHPEWTLVPLAYCAAQLVAFLPITPGGLGLVEGSLTVALIGGGRGGTAVLAAVLLYRIVSYWGTLPVGLLGYLAVRRTGAGSLSRAETGVQPAPQHSPAAP